MPHEVHGVGVGLLQERGYLVGDVYPAALPRGVPVGKGVVVVAGEVVADSREGDASALQPALLFQDLQVGERVGLVEHGDDFGRVVRKASVELPEQKHFRLVYADSAMPCVDGLGAQDAVSVRAEHEHGEAVAQLYEVAERVGVVGAEGVAPQEVENFGAVDRCVLLAVLLVKSRKVHGDYPLPVAAAALVVEPCGEDARLADDLQCLLRPAVGAAPAGVLHLFEREPLEYLLVDGRFLHGAAERGLAQEQQRCALLVERYFHFFQCFKLLNHHLHPVELPKVVYRDCVDVPDGVPVGIHGQDPAQSVPLHVGAEPSHHGSRERDQLPVFQIELQGEMGGLSSGLFAGLHLPQCVGTSYLVAHKR